MEFILQLISLIYRMSFQTGLSPLRQRAILEGWDLHPSNPKTEKTSYVVGEYSWPLQSLTAWMRSIPFQINLNRRFILILHVYFVYASIIFGAKTSYLYTSVQWQQGVPGQGNCWRGCALGKINSYQTSLRHPLAGWGPTVSHRQLILGDPELWKEGFFQCVPQQSPTSLLGHCPTSLWVISGKGEVAASRALLLCLCKVNAAGLGALPCSSASLPLSPRTFPPGPLVLWAPGFASSTALWAQRCCICACQGIIVMHYSRCFMVVL